VIDYLNQQGGATLEPTGASSGIKDTRGVLKYCRLLSAPRVKMMRKRNSVKVFVLEESGSGAAFFVSLLFK